MPLADLRTLAQEAFDARRGLGAFNVIHLEHARVLTGAAERAGLPVVLQISQNAVKYHGALAPILTGTLAAAEAASVPVVVHLDHADDLGLIDEAVRRGVSSVMYDGSHLPDDDNRATTGRVVEQCHSAGIAVEAELGEVGGKNGVHDPSARTDPDEAARFVADTGVDLLAVAVGSSHAMQTRDAALDTDLIAAIHTAVPVPLVLHGSSGVSDEGMRAAIEAGMTKINVSTHLNKVFTEQVRAALAADDSLVDSRKYLRPGFEAMGAEAERLLRWYAGEQAAD